MALGRSVESDPDAPAWARLGKEEHVAREQTSKERTKAYVKALEREAEGYELKVKAAKLEKNEAAVAKFEARLKALKDEIARAKKEGQTPVSAEEVKADNKKDDEDEDE